MTQRPSDAEMIAEIERRRAEGTDLDGLIPIATAPQPFKPRAVFSVRLAAEELKEITEAAELTGIPIGDFIRKSALEAARDLQQPVSDRFDALQKEVRDGFAGLRKELHDTLAS